PLLPAPGPAPFPYFPTLPRETSHGNAQNPRKDPFPYFLHAAHPPRRTARANPRPRLARSAHRWYR
ncbi:hypothetical protein, partial [Gordonia otitidis]